MHLGIDRSIGSSRKRDFVRKDRYYSRWELKAYSYKIYNGNHHYCFSDHNRLLQARIHATIYRYVTIAIHIFGF